MAAAPDNKTVTDISKSSDAQPVNSSHNFDLKVVRDAFVNCIQPGDILLVGEYIRAYDELCM